MGSRFDGNDFLSDLVMRVHKAEVFDREKAGQPWHTVL